MRAVPSQSLAQPTWRSVIASVALLGGCAVIDFFIDDRKSLTPLYLLPVFWSTWFLGRRSGYLTCIAAAVVGLLISLRSETATISCWNAGARFCVYVVFCELLSQLRSHMGAGAFAQKARRVIAWSISPAIILVALGWMIDRQFSPRASRNESASLAATQPNSPGPGELASLIEPTMRASRPVLLGSRDPKGNSCVPVVRTGDLRNKTPDNAGDWDGGPGTAMATLYAFGRKDCTSPLADLQWHQTRLKQYLENQAALNEPASENAHQLAEKSLEFSNTASNWKTWPADLLPAGFSQRDDWLGYCMSELDGAIARKDLEQTRHWSEELAAAAFSLEDLHRWLSMLVENQLLALRFQQQCETFFSASAPAESPYVPESTISQYPAGILSLNGWGNYYEVERQAERIFSMPSDRLQEISTNEHLTPGSLWVMPKVRETFLKLRASLSPENQKTWDLAARTPFEHSYLINMLYRANSADATDYLCGVLHKLDANNPHATVGELMSVLMYRGHSFAGLEWADRFQPTLLAVANAIPVSASDQDALMSACRWTNNFYRSNTQYGPTFTLRDALEQKRLDCVRSTDMIGAIFRNAGRTRFGNVRWCAETAGHSVAAYLGGRQRNEQVVVADGLNPPDQPEVWPDCYFHGHKWPPGLENSHSPFAVELYVRGLESYVWAEGYIIRGPNAGMLTTARIPFSTHRQMESTRKVFAGPYPN